MSDRGNDLPTAPAGLAPTLPPHRALDDTLLRPSTLPTTSIQADGAQRVDFSNAPRFRAIRALGEGGMGEVQLVADDDVGRTVAVKRLKPSQLTPEGMALFSEEVRVLGALDHPGVVPIHDVGRDAAGRPYFVMKHVRGQTMEEVIAGLVRGDAALHARFPFFVRVQLAIDLLHVLGHAHQQGLIHRDVKPANVMVGPQDEVTLMDWGLAQRVAEPTQPTPAGAPTPVAAISKAPLPAAPSLTLTLGDGIAGTPLYMSPEQARGVARLDRRSDLYSVAVLLHELLYLRHYLADRTTLEGVMAGVVEQVPPVNDGSRHPTQPMVPQALGWFLERALAKEREERFATAEEMVEELRAIQEGRVRVQCQVTALKRGIWELNRLLDDHPRGVIVVTGLAASLAVGTLLSRALG